jgi:heptosyltransferase-2
MRILVIAMAGIGDAILATPLIHELRANYPEARIDALVLWAGSKDILEGNPHLNGVYQKNLLKHRRFESLKFLLGVRKNRYQISINTHPQSRRHYRLIARIIGAPIRLSHVYESFALPDRFLVNRTLAQDYGRHSVELNLAALEVLHKKPLLPTHRLEVFLSPEDNAWAEGFVTGHRLAGRKILGIHAGSGGTKNLALKRWPLPQYLQLLGKLRQSWPELAILLFGGPDEDADLEQMLAAGAPPLTVRVRSQNLRQAGALMKRCTTFLSVDTALMHVAAAVNAPRQIVIEAFTLNKTNEPYGNPFTLVPNPGLAGRNLDFYRYDGLGIKGTNEELTRLMSSVSVESVLAAITEQLKAAKIR